MNYNLYLNPDQKETKIGLNLKIKKLKVIWIREIFGKKRKIYGKAGKGKEWGFSRVTSL